MRKVLNYNICTVKTVLYCVKDFAKIVMVRYKGKDDKQDSIHLNNNQLNFTTISNLSAIKYKNFCSVHKRLVVKF